MRRVESSDEFYRLQHVGEGLLYNDYSGCGENGGETNILHVAYCETLQRANTNYTKYHFDTLDEAISWLKVNRGAEGVGWKRCGICHASDPDDFDLDGY